jgi:NAD(P)-dependent dehydrogenase (short-subunit alcohol dehydrogenase family)
MKLQDQVILITGGARVGKVVAQHLIDVGAKVAMTYLESKEEVHEQAQGYQANLTKEEEVRALLPAIEKDLGAVDGLVNMVSVFSPDPTNAKASKESGEITFDFMQHVFGVNAFGNMLLSRQFAQQAQAASVKGAPIVSFIDWAIDHPYAGYDTYMAAKAALRHYLMALQTTFAGTIRVVNIHPGMILEPPGFRPDVKQSIQENTPTQNIGSPQQAAELVKTALELDFLADNIYLAGGQQWRHRIKNS